MQGPAREAGGGSVLGLRPRVKRYGEPCCSRGRKVQTRMLQLTCAHILSSVHVCNVWCVGDGRWEPLRTQEA